MAEDPHGDNPERPEWLPGNFNTPEALAEAWQEAQRKITEQGQQLSAQTQTVQMFSQQLEELAARQQQQPQADPTQVSNQWQEMYENDPIGTQVLLTQQIVRDALSPVQDQLQKLGGTTQLTQQELNGFHAVQSLKETYPDWNELQPDVNALLASNPLFHDKAPVWESLDGTKTALEQAYQIVKATRPADANDPGQGRDMKLSAQGLQGSGGRPAPAEENPWERIKSAGHRTYSELMSGPRS